ncbi:N-acetylmuramoyl-L-alanine amidase [Sphingobacterium sp. Mn56C]|uniref:N-acetylmuramoyl-L-alanine amidase n=1 Tax=Sphingobacterium sp. Mn56C TaxID=3395261 RepID=UPI003BBFF9DE
MGRTSLCWVLLLLLGSSCGTSRKTLVAPKAIPMKDEARVEELSNAKLTTEPVAEVKSPLLQEAAAIKAEMTPEEKVAEQRRTGVNKNADWASAVHYDLRKPNFVIIHHTSQNSTAQTIRTFQVPHSKVSAHYVIGRDGQLVQMLNDYERGWHAGRSKWGTVTDINSVSIGIELDNNGREPFPDAQINTLLVLLETLKSKYLIPQLNFIGHGDIAPTRKDDPSVLFPWKRLAQKGFGIWYNEEFLVDPPATFNPIDALKIIGYDMSNPDAAIRAFKRKYIVTEVNGTLTTRDKAVLYDLYRKYY